VLLFLDCATPFVYFPGLLCNLSTTAYTVRLHKTRCPLYALHIDVIRTDLYNCKQHQGSICSKDQARVPRDEVIFVRRLGLVW